MSQVHKEAVKAQLAVGVSDLRGALTKLKRAIRGSGSSDYVVQHIEFSSTNLHGDVALVTNDTEKGTRVRLNAEVDHFGDSFLIRLDQLESVLEGERGKVEFIVRGEEVEVRVGGIDYTLSILDQEFNQLPLGENMTKLGTLDKERFVELVYMAEDFTFTSQRLKPNARKSLQGIFFNKGKAIMTQGYYMILDEVGELVEDVLMDGGPNLKRVRPTIKNLPGDVVTVWTDDEWVMISGSDHENEVFLQQIDADFPEYEAVVPEHNDLKLQVDVEQLYHFVNKASKIAGVDSSEEVVLTIQQGAESVNLTHRDPEVGEMATEITSNYPTYDFKYSFKAEFMANILENVKEHKDEVSIWFSDKETAMLIEGRSGRKYVQMPIKD